MVSGRRRSQRQREETRRNKQHAAFLPGEAHRAQARGAGPLRKGAGSAAKPESRALPTRRGRLPALTSALS